MRQFIGGSLLICLAFAAPAEVLPLDDLLSGISARALVDGAIADLSMPGQLPEPPNTEAGWPRDASRHVNRATDKSLSDALAHSLGIRHPLLSALRQQHLRTEHGAILQALQHALTAQHRASLSLSPAQERFNVAKLALTEQQLSNAAGAEPDIGALQMSELEVHRAALEVINRWYTVWKQLSGLQLFFTDNAQRTALTGGNMAHWAPLNANTADFKASRNWEQGVYMWDSRTLLSSAAQAETLARLERAGIKRLYIGLSTEQLAQPDIIRMLDATVMALDSRGFEPVLLLGDPDWMVPEHRASLIAIISKLGSVGFAALHLDLEVEQRGWPVAPHGWTR